MFRVVCLIGMILFSVGVTSAQTTNHQVYALYVINIAKYCMWPNTNGELKLAVYGKTKVYEELIKHNGKVINGSTLKVYQAEGQAAIGEPHIIYLPDNRSSNLDDLVRATEGKSVMIIAEREGLHKKGAGFSFIILDNSSLRFDLNHTELEKRSIKVPKSLTSLAHSSI
jgi:hypothetical protein